MLTALIAKRESATLMFFLFLGGAMKKEKEKIRFKKKREKATERGKKIFLFFPLPSFHHSSHESALRAKHGLHERRQQC